MSLYLHPPASLDHEETWAFAGVIVVVQYAYPVFLLFFFLLASTIRSITASNPNSNVVKPITSGPRRNSLPPTRNLIKQRERVNFTRSQKLLFIWLSVIAAATFIGNSALSIAYTVINHTENWWAETNVAFYLVGSFFVYCLFSLSLIDSKSAPTAAHLATWIVATMLETVVVSLSIIPYGHTNKQPTADLLDEHLSWSMTTWEAAGVAVDFLRIAVLLVLVGFYLAVVALRQPRGLRAHSRTRDEATRLLMGADRESGHVQNGSYGSASPIDGKKPTTEPRAPTRSWWEYFKGYQVLFPYLWPSKDRELQGRVVICFILLLVERIVNMFVPNQIGHITDKFQPGELHNLWKPIMFFIILQITQGDKGLLGISRSTLWIPVRQKVYQDLSIAGFEHVLNLSQDFHISQSTGEVLSALGKGGAINKFLEYITFKAIPILLDLIIAISYFLYKFDAIYALILVIIIFCYIPLTVRMTHRRTKARREMVNAEREQVAVKNESMVAFETIKYFNTESYESGRYRNFVLQFQHSENAFLRLLATMDISLNVLFMLGLLIVCLTAASRASKGAQGPGDFIAVTTYMLQLKKSLESCSIVYQKIQSALVNSERMLELFKEKPTVEDKPDTKHLSSCDGNLRFNNICFSYISQDPTLTELNFNCSPGTTTAFVGESGSGKSTILRLIYRFLDAQGGSIQIDSRDIKDFTIKSTRSYIGVVPQDTILFNESIMYNVRYARQDATDEEVYDACRAACIHDRILGFKNKYNAHAGELGHRLSGGERQRIAIARVLLQDPRIAMLDEATSALDTGTEEQVQKAFTTLGQGRTVLIIAHRLSTITHADQILVLHGGRIVERGTHEELLNKKGRYSAMWRKQNAQKTAEELKGHTNYLC